MVVTIIEGGELAWVLSKVLLLFNHTINIIIPLESADKYKMNEPSLNLIPGKGTDTDILGNPIVTKSDIVIALMDKGVDNLLSCLYIKERNRNVKTVMKADNVKFQTKYEELGIDIAINYESIMTGLFRSAI